MWPFKKRKKDNLIDIGNPEPNLDKYAKAYRLERIAEIAEYTGKSVKDATELADKWFIRTLQVQIGDDPMKIQYCPTPVWDDEWMFRETFDTKEQAFAHIMSKKGELLVPNTD